VCAEHQTIYFQQFIIGLKQSGLKVISIEWQLGAANGCFAGLNGEDQ
jgi:hypothetical protein